MELDFITRLISLCTSIGLVRGIGGDERVSDLGSDAVGVDVREDDVKGCGAGGDER